MEHSKHKKLLITQELLLPSVTDITLQGEDLRQFLMPETPPIGTPFHAMVLQPLSETFPVVGEVVIGKILNEQGDFRIRSWHPGPFQQTEEFRKSHMVLIRVVPDTDKPKRPRKL